MGKHRNMTRKEMARSAAADELRACVRCGKPKWFHYLPRRMRFHLLYPNGNLVAMNCPAFVRSPSGKVAA